MKRTLQFCIMKCANICKISINKYLPNSQWIMLQNEWVKDLFKFQDRSRDFNKPEYKNFIDKISDPILHCYLFSIVSENSVP